MYGPLPALWFGGKDETKLRSLAVSLAVQSNYAGWCLGSFVIPKMIKQEEDFDDVMFVQAAIVSLNLILFIFVYRDPDNTMTSMDNELLGDNVDSKETEMDERKITEIITDLLSNTDYVVNVSCVVLLGGVSFAISGILDSVVTSNDERFDDDDASYMNCGYILSGVLSGVIGGVLIERGLVGKVETLLSFMFVCSTLGLTLVSFAVYRKHDFDETEIWFAYVLGFVLSGIGALGFCGAALGLALDAAKNQSSVNPGIAVLIPEIGLNAFGAIVTQITGAEFWVCTIVSWSVLAMWVIWLGYSSFGSGGGGHRYVAATSSSHHGV